MASIATPWSVIQKRPARRLASRGSSAVSFQPRAMRSSVTLSSSGLNPPIIRSRSSSVIGWSNMSL